MKLPLSVIGLALVSATPALAQDRGVAFAGGSAGNGAIGYAGVVVALPGDSLGNGFAVRASGGGGTYRYQGAPGEVEAEYVSGELALVYQMSGSWGWANLSAGPRVSHTRLSPEDLSNRLRGTRVDAALQTDGAVGQAWQLGWFGSLGVNDRAYVTEVRLGRLVSDAGTRLGVEGGLQGDRSYTRGNAGAFVSTRLAPKWEARLSGGVTEEAGRNARGYVSLGASHVF